MIGQRKIFAAVGVLASLFTAAATVPAAHARAVAPAAATHPTRTVTLTPADNGAVRVNVTGSPTTAAIAAVPSTSPAVTHVFVPNGGTYTCSPGYACAAVPYGSGAYVFKFVHYDGYSVSNWIGYGSFLNNQTGNAGARYDDVSGHERGCVPAGILRNRIYWYPVWRVRLTASRC